MPDADVARAATGYERGTITPVGSSTAWPVFADQRVTGRIALDSGERDQAMFVDADELVSAYDATVADLST
jgi:Cys-tRNA(Pro)/Cys-tRNA(Cys) deacylase